MAGMIDWRNPPPGALLLDVEGKAVLVTEGERAAFVFRDGAEPAPFPVASAMWNGAHATPAEFEALIKAWPAASNSTHAP